MYFDLSKQYVSSTNLFQSFTLSFKFDISDVSSSAMNILARSGTNGEHCHTTYLWVSLCKVSLSNINCTFLSRVLISE